MEVKYHQNMATEIWLNYFNDVLYDKGIITETKRNKMKHLIYDKYNNAKNSKSKKIKYPQMPSVVIKREEIF